MVAAILLVLPLGAVWLAGRWRGPPPERRGSRWSLARKRARAQAAVTANS